MLLLLSFPLICIGIPTYIEEQNTKQNTKTLDPKILAWKVPAQSFKPSRNATTKLFLAPANFYLKSLLFCERAIFGFLQWWSSVGNFQCFW